ncbi:MAG: DUF2007 domain-containing protein [Niabella sp.]
MNYKILATYDNYIAAHLALGLLQENDINCWLKDENTVTIYPGSTFAVGGIKLMVAEVQLERAAQILAANRAAHLAKKACPRCGSKNVEYVGTPRKASNWLANLASAVFGGGVAMPVDKVMHCFDCGHEYEVDE